MLLDVRRDHRRLDPVEVGDAARRAPAEKLRDGLGIRGARVAVADIRGEEFDEAPGGAFAGARDRRGQVLKAGAVQVTGWDWNDVGAHGVGQID